MSIPNETESARLDDLTAYCSTLLNHLKAEALDEALAGVAKRRGQCDTAFRKRTLDSTHPDDLAAALASQGLTLASFGISSIQR